jgi:hypothetical protein
MVFQPLPSMFLPIFATLVRLQLALLSAKFLMNKSCKQPTATAHTLTHSF